jgi:hypothetical protein
MAKLPLGADVEGDSSRKLPSSAAVEQHPPVDILSGMPTMNVRFRTDSRNRLGDDANRGLSQSFAIISR